MVTVRKLQSFIYTKYFIDLVLIFLSLPVWLPVLAIAVLVTYLDSGRPCFFIQRRMGLNCRPFNIIKIRTMDLRRKAPRNVLFDGWTYPDDPRITRVGRYLRRYRIDELPQIFNVLKGDMSLVGPRPEPWEVASDLGRNIPRYHDRHLVRPGLTGLCQISPDYLRFGTVELSAVKLQHDLMYMEKHSLLIDLKILLSTLKLVVRGVGVS